MDAEAAQLLDREGEAVDAELVHARHRGHLPLDAAPGDDEQRVDEVVGAEPGLAHQAAQPLGAAEATEAAEGAIRGGHR